MSDPSRLASRLLGGFAVFAVHTTLIQSRARAAENQAAAKPAGSADARAEQVTVRGTTNTIAAAHAQRRDAPNIVNIRTLAEMRKLPDINVAEALQRMPGVSLESDTGEGRFINVRGLDADLNSVSFGGVRLMPSNQASPFGGSRAVALDAIPTGFVGAVEITKTTRPDQDAEALGATIEIVPRKAPAGGAPFVDIDIGGGYEPLRNTPVVDGGITLGASFGLGRGRGPFDKPAFADSGWVTNPRPFSFLATASFYNDQRGVDDAEAAFSDQQSAGLPDKLLSTLELRRYQYTRRRYSRGGELDFDPNPDNHVFVRFAEAGYHEHVTRHRLVLGSLDSGQAGCDGYADCLAGTSYGGFIAPQATASQTLRDEAETIQNDVLTLGGRSLLDGIKIDYHGAWSRGEDNRPYDYNSTYTDPNTVALAYNNISRPNVPTVTTLDGTNLANTGLYQFSSLANNSQKNVDSEWSGGVNAQLPLPILHDDGSLKFGVLLRLRKRSTTQVVSNYTPTGTLPYSDFTYGPDQIYYKNKYDLGPTPSAGIKSVIGTSLVTQDKASDLIASAQGDQQDTENVYAGYAQYEATFGKLHLLAGMRLEDTEGTYNANTVATDAAGNSTITPAQNKQSYLDYFPTVQARYAFRPDLIGRLSYSTAIARPGFNQISAATQVNYGTGTVTQGNPSLSPTTGDDFDASLEYYRRDLGVMTLAAFDKQFHNYILPRQVFSTFPGIAGIAAIQSFSNVPDAQAYGVEADYNRKFDFLPGLLRNLGFEGNYTWVSSNTQIRPGESASLPSTSNNNLNAALYYEDKRIGFRLAGSYVSRNLFAIGSSAATDIYAAPRFRLDAGATYAISPKVTFYLDAKNLTDTPLKFTEGSSDSRVIQREIYDVTVLGGLRASF